jgi:hypothetical protein
MNITNSDYSNSIYKEDSAACIALQTTKYIPDVHVSRHP